jgi:hypothetical protein
LQGKKGEKEVRTIEKIQLGFMKIANPLFYHIRSLLRFRRSGAAFPYEEKEGSPREEVYRKRYSFEDAHRKFSRMDYTLSLYHLQLLERLWDGAGREVESIKALDVGSKNFYYAEAFYRFYREKGHVESLVGVEVDAYRVYDDFRSRHDYAMLYLSGLKDTTYRPMDILDYQNTHNVITTFLPFVFEEPLLYWGLPMGMYRPKEVMGHIHSLLEENGVWFITNQGKEEQERQHRILRELKIPFTDAGEFRSEFVDFPHPHYLTVARKTQTD